MVTFDNHGFNEETVKFFFIDYCPSSMGTELSQWGFKAMRVNKHDYTAKGSPRTARWVVAEKGETLMLFNLKYKNKVIMEASQKEMDEIMKSARKLVNLRVSHSFGYGLDYMDAVSTSTVATTAIGRFIRKNRNFR